MKNNYKTINKLHKSQKTEIHRSIRESDGLSVILKIRDEFTPLQSESGLVHEYELGKTLQGEYSVKYIDFDNIDKKSIVVLHDDNMISLDSVIPDNGFDILQFLELSIEIVSAIEEIHSQGVIHKDINPTNIIVNYALNRVKLIDFGLSTKITEEVVGFEPPSVLQGNLSYISPEQTGRINKTVDTRTDLYSLGVSFYQMITGILPFDKTDPAELIYSHIAKIAAPVSKIRQDIPQALLLVIEKLLMKSPEERYQTASGVKNDLIYLQKVLLKDEKIVDFNPGKMEQSDKIIFPEKLYGRGNEIDQLLCCFNKCNESGQIVTVTGLAGIGKTALIRELYTPITTRDGFFLRGKFDQFNIGVGYRAFADALKDFIRQCLGQSEDKIKLWRSTVQSSVCDFGQVVTDIVPEFENLIGKQKNVAPVSPLETVARLNKVFSDLINDISQMNTPIVIHLDDLQWADSAAISLIEKIIEINPENLFIILSYRNDEINPIHPAKQFLDNLNIKKNNFTNIHLNNLSKEGVGEWIYDIFQNVNLGIKDLIDLVMGKTEGNPFYIESLLHLIIENKYVKRDKAGEIFLDMDGITAIPADVDVIEHLIKKIGSLDIKISEFLKEISILGNKFPIDSVELYLQKNKSECHDAIQTLVEFHLLIKSGNILMFAHDKIHQAARIMLDDDRASFLHLQVGEKIQSSLDVQGLTDEHIEDYIHHFNASSDLITDENQRLELARSNIVLGKRLKKNAAYESAENSFAQAVKFLPSNHFETEHSLAIDLFIEYGETLFLNLKYSEGEKQFDKVILNSRSPIDSARVYIKQINHYAAHHNLEKAMKMALHALKILNMKLPEKMLKIAIIPELLKVKNLLKNKNPEEILNFPVSDDPLVLAQMDLLSAAVVPAYLGYPDYYPIIIFKMMAISIKKGNCTMSPFAYIGYAIILCSLGELEKGYQYGKAAIKLMEILNASELNVKVPYSFSSFVHHWKMPMRDSLEFFKTAVTKGLEIGDYEFASYAVINTIIVPFYYGENIDTLLNYYPKQHKLLENFGKDRTIYQAKYFHQFLITLNNMNGDGITVSGDILDENWFIPLLEERQDLSSLALCNVTKMQLAYIAGNLDIAEKIRVKAIESLKSLTGTMFIPIAHYFSALISIALFRKRGKGKYLLSDAKRSLKKLRKWGTSSPDNYLYKAQLIDAELLSVKGKVSNALKLYEAAIKNSEKSGNNLDHGIACECMGRYLISIGLDSLGVVQISQSINIFYNWGALNKSARLSKEYNIDIIKDILPGVTRGSEKISEEINSQLDLEALAGTIKLLTGDLKFESLLTTLLEAIMMRSGATRVVYIHVDQGELQVKAEKLINSDVKISNGGKVNPALFELSDKLIKKCISGSDEHVLENVSIENKIYGNDERKKQLKSVLIIPLVRNKLMKGMVYLENDLMEDAFREDHVQFVSLLAGQATIAIENAIVFEELQNSEEKLRLLTTNLPSVMIYQVIIKPDGTRKFSYVSDNIISINGISRDSVLADSNVLYNQVLPEHLPDLIEKENRALLKMITFKHETELCLPDGEHRWFELISTPHLLPGGSVAWDGVEIDINDRKITEQKLHQSQKMDAIGQLAGGVAHDFNNMLAGIIGAAQLLKSPKSSLDEKGIRYVDIILKAATRAADLTSKLLAFGRKGKIVSSTVDVNKIIDDSIEILNRTIDKKISISFKKGAEKHFTIGDNSELQNAFMNIGINASHAMPDGGDIVIETKNIKLNKLYCETSIFELEPGEYIEIEIRDTGLGISPKNINKIFEPFYTTKEQGKGTGLGLAAVYGIVQDHHGEIYVYSEIGEGTSFHILLPCSEDDVVGMQNEKEVITGTGKILLVDDEEIIRITGKHILEEMNYNVLLAENGYEAIEIFKEQYGEIDLVIMDMIMPEINGREAFFKMKEIDKNCKIVISSGFTRSESLDELRENGLAGFIHKPYRDWELSKLLADILKN